MELDVNFSKAQGAVTNAECDLEIAKEAYAQVHSSKKKKAKVNKGEAALADSQSRPEVGVSEVERLQQDGVSAYVGCFASAIALAATQAAAKYNTPVLIDVGVSDLIVSRGLKNVFRLAPGFGKCVDDAIVALGEVNKAARAAKRERRAHDNTCVDYPNLAVQNMGGTKPQNISQLNSERRGMNYLLSSLPPQWKASAVRLPVNATSVFDRLFIARPDVRRAVKALHHFLESDPEPNLATRQYRETLTDVLIDELVSLAAELHRVMQPGWSRDDDRFERLDTHEKLWLDPLRAELPEESDFAKQWLALEGQTYAVKPEPYRLQHPTRPDAYEPTLRHNQASAWQHEADRPLEWEGVRLLRRLGFTGAEFSDEEALRALRISGSAQATLTNGVDADVVVSMSRKETGSVSGVVTQVPTFCGVVSNAGKARMKGFEF